MPGLQLSNIVKRYKGDTVLDQISLAVPQGETLVLFGPSGAGKSVLLRLIAGVIDPDEGHIHIDDRDMSHVVPEQRGVGMAFQNFALFPHMTAEKNIASSLEVTEPSKARISDAVRKVATLLKIQHVLDHTPRALSNGQKQRTALARALVGSPSLLLLDDPLRNVDAKLRFEMRLELPALLAEQGTTVVYVTQDYKEAMALGDQIAVLDAGSVQQTGTPEEIYLYPASVDIARQFGDPAINLLNISIDKDSQGLHGTLSEQRIPLPNDIEWVAGVDCVLGVRAESIRFVQTDAPGAIPVTIEAVTPLNEKTVMLALTSCGQEILISQPGHLPKPAEGQACIVLQSDALHLFDSSTGRRLKTADMAAGAAA